MTRFLRSSIACGLAAAAVAVPFARPARAQEPTPAQAPCALPAGTLDAQALMMRSAACVRAERMLDAGKLWYAGSIRMRTLARLDDQPDRFPAIMASLQEEIGGPVNAWLGGDLHDWLAAMDWALDWDRRTGYAELSEVGNGSGVRVEPARARAAYLTVRDGLRELRADMAAKGPASIYRLRRAAGLEVRDPRFDAATGRMRSGS